MFCNLSFRRICVSVMSLAWIMMYRFWTRHLKTCVVFTLIIFFYKLRSFGLDYFGVSDFTSLALLGSLSRSFRTPNPTHCWMYCFKGSRIVFLSPSIGFTFHIRYKEAWDYAKVRLYISISKVLFFCSGTASSLTQYSILQWAEHGNSRERAKLLELNDLNWPPLNVLFSAKDQGQS